MAQRNALFVITGAIGASLMPTWLLDVRQQQDWDIQCVLSPGAEHFVSATALAAITGSNVYTTDDWWTRTGSVLHKEMAYWADFVIVAPASLNFLSSMAALASGDLARATVAFGAAPTFVLPAVSGPVAEKASYRRMLDALSQDGHRIVLPASPSVSLHGFAPESGGMATLDDLYLSIKESGHA